MLRHLAMAAGFALHLPRVRRLLHVVAGAGRAGGGVAAGQAEQALPVGEWARRPDCRRAEALCYPCPMTITTVTPSQVETGLAAILERVQRGEEVIIARDGAPIARIVPAVTSDSGPRPFGTAIGLIELRPGWDDPLTDEELDEIENGPVFPVEA